MLLGKWVGHETSHLGTNYAYHERAEKRGVVENPRVSMIRRRPNRRLAGVVPEGNAETCSRACDKETWLLGSLSVALREPWHPCRS